MKVTHRDLLLHGAPLARDFISRLRDPEGQPVKAGLRLFVDREREVLGRGHARTMLDTNALWHRRFVVAFAEDLGDLTPILGTFPELKGRRRVPLPERLRYELMFWLGSWYGGRWGFRNIEPVFEGDQSRATRFVRRWARGGLPDVLPLDAACVRRFWEWTALPEWAAAEAAQAAQVQRAR